MQGHPSRYLLRLELPMMFVEAEEVGPEALLLFLQLPSRRLSGLFPSQRLSGLFLYLVQHGAGPLGLVFLFVLSVLPSWRIPIKSTVRL